MKASFFTSYRIDCMYIFDQAFAIPDIFLNALRCAPVPIPTHILDRIWAVEPQEEFHEDDPGSAASSVARSIRRR